MPYCHYALTFRPDLRLMDVAWHRHFTVNDVAAYARACWTEFDRHGFYPGYLLRMDMSRSAIQPQNALAMFRTQFAGFPQARRIAIVTASALARLQVQREMTQSYLQIFDRADTAFAWLTQDVAAVA
jgi:hypothetical protein|tara:strand:+ start:427 stop:807 length:381 start_codon:yes stop_codon:yes gene_type:complete